MDMDPFSNNYKNSCSIFSRSDWVSFCRNTLKNHRVIFKYIMNLLRAYLIASMPFAAVFAIKNNKSGTFLGFTGGITLEGTVNASVVFSGNNTCAGGLLVNLYS